MLVRKKANWKKKYKTEDIYAQISLVGHSIRLEAYLPARDFRKNGRRTQKQMEDDLQKNGR